MVTLDDITALAEIDYRRQNALSLAGVAGGAPHSALRAYHSRQFPATLGCVWRALWQQRAARLARLAGRSRVAPAS